MAYTWFVVAAFLAACNSKPTSATPPPAPKDAGPAVIEQHSAGFELHRFDEPKIDYPLRKELVILDKGALPARLLRYAPKAGTTSYATLSRLAARKLVKGVWRPLETMPPIKGGLVVTAGSPGAGLAARILASEVVGTPTPAAQAYIAAQQPLGDRRITFSFDNQGQLDHVAFADDPDGKRSAVDRDEMTQRLVALAIPLPEQKVGVGAKWRAVTILRQAPAIVKQTATYTLSAIDADKWTIDVEIRRAANNQRLTAPDAPGPAVDLVALLRVFTGTLVVDAKRPFGTGMLSVTSTLHIRAQTAAGQQEEITDDNGSIEVSATE